MHRYQPVGQQASPTEVAREPRIQQSPEMRRFPFCRRNMKRQRAGPLLRVVLLTQNRRHVARLFDPAIYLKA